MLDRNALLQAQTLLLLCMVTFITACGQSSQTQTAPPNTPDSKPRESNSKLALNQRALGTTADTAEFQRMLTDVLKRRQDQTVVKPGTSEIERTVYVKAEPSIGLREVIKVIEIAKEAGASPVLLPIEVELEKAGDMKPNPLTLLITIGEPQRDGKVFAKGIEVIVGPSISRSESGTIPKEFVIVTIRKDREYLVAENTVAKSALANELKSQLKGRADQRIYLVLDSNAVTYSSLSDVAYAGFEAGASEIYTITLN